MSDIILKPHTFFAAVTASGVSPWVELDHRFSGEQTRSISGYRTDTACPVQLFVKTVVPVFNSDGKRGTDVEVTATVTTWAAGGRAFFSTAIIPPATHVQVFKVNSSGAATIVGVI